MLGDVKQWNAPRASFLPGRRAAPDFPGFLTGVLGDGPTASLDPRFAVSRDPLADKAYEALQALSERPWEPPAGALEGALAEHQGMQGASLRGTLGGLMGAGRGLRASDRARIEKRSAETAAEERQGLRELFDRLSASGRITDAQRKESLFGALPGLDVARNRSNMVNADRLLAEQTAWDKYKTDAYNAKAQRNASEGLAAAAG